LVADDNSNIQRMVSLALKDHGIDVVAVGNGEAAVRSMAQLKPDLILADVFMPVRSGYEVCEYVKNDTRFSHIPVILLLGAFDPLDEAEAKRVGADGVLKKPFVPPDPMIALVKAMLEKSAPERLEPVAVAVASEVHAAPVQPVFQRARVIEALPSIEESPEIDYPPMGRDAFETAAPAAVAPPHMEASAQTEVEDSEVMTQQRDAALGEPSFWHPAEPEEAAEGAQEDEHAGENDHALGHEFEPVAPKPGYFDSPIVEDEAPAEAVVEPQAAAQPEPAAYVETDPQFEIQSESWAETAAASEPAASEEYKPESAADENDWLMPPPVAADPDFVPSNEDGADAGSDWTPGPVTPMIELGSSGESAFAPASAVWNEPDAAAAEIESSVSHPAAEPATDKAASLPESDAWYATAALKIGQPAQELADTQKIPAEAVAAATHAQEVSFASESPTPAHADVAPAASVSGTEAPFATSASTDEMVNAVVARVLEKLQPKIADMINEDFLKPVVSALVRGELDKK
ncbi:MAG: response regulator, partial [Candidatus Acidiferrales bacterium]